MDLINYTYHSPKYILENITLLKDLSNIEYLIFGFFILFIIFFILFILPSFFIIIDYHRKQKIKREKKNLLKQILLQKEIEDEIVKIQKKNDLNNHIQKK